MSLNAAIGPGVAADEIFAAPNADQDEIIRRHFEEGLAGVTSPTLEAFAAAVARELADLHASGGRRGPEAPLRPPALPGLEPVPRAEERLLEPLLGRVAERGRKLLPPSLKANLGGAALPPIALDPKGQREHVRHVDARTAAP